MAGDTNERVDVFRFHRPTGATVRASLTNAGGQSAFGGGSDPALSADGSELAFTSAAPDLGPVNEFVTLDVYLRRPEPQLPLP